MNTIVTYKKGAYYLTKKDSKLAVYKFKETVMLLKTDGVYYRAEDVAASSRLEDVKPCELLSFCRRCGRNEEMMVLQRMQANRNVQVKRNK